MAINVGPLVLTGKIRGLSFYESQGKNIVRTTGGPSRQQVLQGANFTRTRENASEFGRTQKDTRLLWQQCLRLIGKDRDGQANRRLFQLMLKAMQGDIISTRGERSLREGFKSPAYQKLFCGFEFNLHAPVHELLRLPIELDSTTNSIRISDFNPKLHLKHPETLHFVNFSAAIITAEQQSWELNFYASTIQEVPLNNVVQNIQLTFPDPIDKTDCFCFYLFKLSFLDQPGTLPVPNPRYHGGVVLRMEAT